MATKVKLENKLQAIYKEQGYDIDCDNRSYFTKSINKMLCNDSVKFILCEKGYSWKRKKDDYKYNLKILIEGKGKIFNLTSLDPESICNCFAKVAQMEHIKELVHVHQDAYVCDKCNGKGIIPAFMHVCNGVCFDCLGIGYKFKSGKW